jgi:hypothetical protein
MSKTIVVETRKQHARIVVTQSLDVSITIGVETVVVHNIDVVRRGILIRSTIKLGSESYGASIIRNLN